MVWIEKTKRLRKLHHSYLDKYGDLDSPVHRIDAAIKILSAFLAIVIMVSEPPGKLYPFAVYALIILIIAVLSKVPGSYIAKRLIRVFPFIMIMAAFYPLTVNGFRNPASLSFSDQHVLAGFSILLKASLSVSILILLASVEKFHALLGGLRKLKFPVILGVLSALMYRYIFILSDEVMRTNRARSSRTNGNLKGSKLKVLGNQLATVFIRSLERSRTVYASMISRGFTGEFPSMSEKTIKRGDVAIFCTFGFLLLYIRFMENIHLFFIKVS